MHPPVGDAHEYTHCKPALCRGARTPSSSSEFAWILKKVEHQLLNPLHISRICRLSLHQVRLGHQVRSTDHTSRKVRGCVMATVFMIIMKHVMALGHLYLFPNAKKSILVLCLFL